MATVPFPRMHVSLYVSDLAASINFYTAFFGQPADKVKAGYAKYVLDNPALVISFVENKERVQGNFGHLGFQVETEQELAQRLLAAQSSKLEVLEEMGTNCCYANQDKFWVSDPDGHQWEVYYFHEDVAFNDPHYALGESSNCCVTPETAATGEAPTLQTKLVEEQGNSCAPGSGCC